MTKGTESIHRKDLGSFKRWVLQTKGYTEQSPTNDYEVFRAKGPGGTAVVHRKADPRRPYRAGQHAGELVREWRGRAKAAVQTEADLLWKLLCDEQDRCARLEVQIMELKKDAPDEPELGATPLRVTLADLAWYIAIPVVIAFVAGVLTGGGLS